MREPFILSKGSAGINGNTDERPEKGVLEAGLKI